jgi:basic membrane lipoprotein Med (substrate-binding protein (PBP1-ABC) superfamily)
MYLIGRYYGKGSVVKFSKRTFVVDYRLGFHCNSNTGGSVTPAADSVGVCTSGSTDIGSTGTVPINDIYTYMQPEGQDAIYACGFAYQDMTTDTLNKYATMFKMSTSGSVQYIRRWGTYDADTTQTDVSSDRCRSIAYDTSNRQVILLLEVRS